jgi:hypothetical protein
MVYFNRLLQDNFLMSIRKRTVKNKGMMLIILDNLSSSEIILIFRDDTFELDFKISTTINLLQRASYNLEGPSFKQS